MKQFEKILEKIARTHGNRPGEGRDRLLGAQGRAFAPPGGGAWPLWGELAFRGERPTPGELVLQLAALLQKSTTPAG